jgi:hypothetical protein
MYALDGSSRAGEPQSGTAYGDPGASSSSSAAPSAFTPRSARAMTFAMGPRDFGLSRERLN